MRSPTMRAETCILSDVCCRRNSLYVTHAGADLGDLAVDAVLAVGKVVLLLDVREHAAADAHHPQELVDVVARISVGLIGTTLL